MPTEILMPALSPTMEEGKLAKWLIKEGQAVKAGDVIAEIETDKATMEVEAVDEGKVGRLLVAEGTEGVKVNTPIAVLLDEGESAAAAPASKPAAPPPQPTPSPPRATPAAAAKTGPATGPSVREPTVGGRRDWCANGAQRQQPRLRLAVGTAARQGRRARHCCALRLRSPRAHRQDRRGGRAPERRRGRSVRCRYGGDAAAGRRCGAAAITE
jgi:pyruvate dehydrogenase E2 component (dihydrolipoamide acetyltransferase)